MANQTIRRMNTGFNPVFILSFDSEKEFVDANINEFFTTEDQKTRKSLLREVYREAKKLNPQNADE